MLVCHSGTMESRNLRRSSVTLKTLAQRVGVAPGTVAKVLNNAAGANAISEVTKLRIRAAACELRYRPNLLAQSLRKGRSHMVGVLLREIEGAHGALLLSSIEQFLWPRGYLCIAGVHQNRGSALQAYTNQFLRCGVEGMITVDVSFPYGAALPTVAVKTPQNAFRDRYDRVNSTAFRQFVEQLGQSAAETLLARIEDSAARTCGERGPEDHVDC